MSKKLRQVFADLMTEVGQEDKRLAVLVGDISHGILKPFAAACPGRYYNVGICEPTIMSMGAGLNKVGLVPVVHTIAPFLVERSFEQIKLDFGYQNLSGNIITVGSAFDYSALGCSHHCYGDFAMLKTLPRTVVVYPGSDVEFRKLFKDIYANKTINYFRLSEFKHDLQFSEDEVYVGKPIRVREGKDLTVVVTGPMLSTALGVCEKLKADNVSCDVLYVHTIKPLDEQPIKASLMKTKKCIVIEEHSMFGGLSESIAKIAVGTNDMQIEYSNLGNDFITQYGTYEELCASVGLDVPTIFGKVKKLFRDKY
jgi:transketolase